jgi:hypothetical protein
VCVCVCVCFLGGGPTVACCWKTQHLAAEGAGCMPQLPCSPLDGASSAPPPEQGRSAFTRGWTRAGCFTWTARVSRGLVAALQHH